MVYGNMIDAQPLGPGTKVYTHMDGFEMLEDLVPYSGFETKFDPLGLISQKPKWAQTNMES